MSIPQITRFAATAWKTTAFFAEVQVEPDAKNILKYLARIEKQQSRDCRIVCGYEAGCLGYSLYHQLV